MYRPADDIGPPSRRPEREELQQHLRGLRAANYARRKAIPRVRALTDAELTKRIRVIHAESDGACGSPRVDLLMRSV